MLFRNILRLLFNILIGVHSDVRSSKTSENKPNLSSYACWDPDAIIFANDAISFQNRFIVFVDQDNNVYASDRDNKRVHVWYQVNGSMTKTILNTMYSPVSLTVTMDGDIFIGFDTGSVEKMRLNKMESVVVMNITNECYALFIDINNNLYCSLEGEHQVVKQSLDRIDSIPITVAGTGFPGSTSDKLYRPRGIVVDKNLSLYVADCYSSRIQMFKFEEMHGITVAGNAGLTRVKLNCPSGVFLDDNNSLFIVDQNNHRIIRLAFNVLYCVVGCSKNSGTESNQLWEPTGAAFDTFGNIYVGLWRLSRIQKFILMSNDFDDPTGVESMYSSVLTSDSPMYSPPTCGAKKFTYESIQMKSSESGRFSFNRNSSVLTSAFVYKGNFNLFNSFANSISTDDETDKSDQFKLTVYLQANIIYTLVVAMHSSNLIGSFSIIVSGPGNVSFDRINMLSIQSIYSSILNTNSQTYERNNCSTFAFFYEAIEIEVGESNHYNIRSDSNINTYGSIYKHKFDPNNPNFNLHVSNDNCDDEQFKLFIYLESNIPYILVVTTFYTEKTGPFSILVSGAKNVSLKRINASSVIRSTYSSALKIDSPIYLRSDCETMDYYYESIEINVIQSSHYVLRSDGKINIYGHIYKHNFDPNNPSKNKYAQNSNGCGKSQFKFDIYLESNITYILVVTTISPKEIGAFSVSISGPNNATLKHNNAPRIIQSIYSSELSIDSQTYSRDCGLSNYYYDAIEMSVVKTGLYRFSSNSHVNTYGYIYKNNFSPLNPFKDIFAQDDDSCSNSQFKLYNQLQAGVTYILVVTTFRPNISGEFSIQITGPKNVYIKLMDQSTSRCFVGDRCQFYTKNIGITLDDILHNEIQSNKTLKDQSLSIKISAALTMIMFGAGLINSVFSFATFQNEDLRKTGCGMYLLASSITSLLIIFLFAIKFWFFVFSQMNGTSIDLSVHRGGCIYIESLLKLLLYLDGWFNSCVAIERVTLVLKGIHFNKKKSKIIAQWIILVLPLCVMITIIHEPLYRKSFVYETKEPKSENNQTERRVWCLTHYSSLVENYNTGILFFHLVGPFIVNLLSTLFIIFGTARQRSVTQNRQTYGEHLRAQFSEHKQLIISPIILLFLSLPRLIISLLPGCLSTSRNPWLFLAAYYISFTPSILVFAVFVLPSKLYRKRFKQSLRFWRR